MSKKRKYATTGLYSELSEYSSLLRALRTSTTLDLSSHLTAANAPIVNTRYDGKEDASVVSNAVATLTPRDGDPEGSSSALPDSQALTAVDPEEYVDTPTEDSDPSSAPRKKARISAPATVRDTWTKWPLVPSEVHIPEWPFDEEVRILAVDALHRLRSPAQEDDEQLDPNDQFDDALNPVTLRALTRATAKHLYEILGASSAMLPESEDSLQNRHGYINWELVLSAMDAFGLGNSQHLENVKKRMLVLYPKYDTEHLRDPYFVDTMPRPPNNDIQTILEDPYEFLDRADLEAVFADEDSEDTQAEPSTNPQDGETTGENVFPTPQDDDEWAGSE
ncbi:hypothetical protein BXZ70DRAFT_1006798 [Cristinia sonorae]|uniref:Uncharacterized protein n=1 Tax=Cristinia sonorae TaxID=1940300 RepID=A0A8K0UTE4_9AGAR|nr:hypothetical protein BXZ70DRAFT_1006798 [Cristinia sonorae]